MFPRTTSVPSKLARISPTDIIDAALMLSDAQRREIIDALQRSLRPPTLADSSAPNHAAAPPRTAFGVDGCRAGWVVVSRTTTGPLTATVVARFADIFTLATPNAIIAVDVPIGLPTCLPAGGRTCDRRARARLGPRAASVFSPPCRAALDAFRRGEAHASVSEVNRTICGAGLSIQAYGILAKIAEVDDLITPDLQTRLVEVHPEVCFAAANERRPLATPKKRAEGLAERVTLLERLGIPVAPLLADRKRSLTGTEADDIVDAAIALWTAERLVAGVAERIADPELDDRGLRMEMWT